MIPTFTLTSVANAGDLPGSPDAASSQRRAGREGADRRQVERFPVEQAATVIGRCEGPRSPLVCRTGTLVDISSFGAQLHCSEKVADSAVWVRYIPSDLVERILEAEVLWSRPATRGGQIVWVHGLKFTATLTPEILDGLLINDVQAAAGSTGSIFDDEEPASVEHIGDTKLWRDDPESLLRDCAHRPTAYPALVESFCPEPFFAAPEPAPAATPPGGFDRRRSARHAARRSGTVSVEAPASAGARSIHIETEDLSAEGVRIVSDSVILTPKVKLRVENVPGLSDEIDCEVRWHAETTAGPFGQHSRQTYGLVFKTPLQAATVDALRA